MRYNKFHASENIFAGFVKSYMMYQKMNQRAMQRVESQNNLQIAFIWRVCVELRVRLQQQHKFYNIQLNNTQFAS